MDIRQVRIIEMSWEQALLFWWKQFWRVFAILVPVTLVMGFIFGLIAGLIGIKQGPALLIGSFLLGAMIGVAGYAWIIRTLFNKKNRIGKYRTCLIEDLTAAATEGR